MVDDGSPEEGHLDISGRFNATNPKKPPRRLQPWERDPLSLQYKNAASFETPVSTDIGNFFRLLLTLVKGVWNGDMADFELLSSVYFPQPPEEKKERTTAPQQEEPPRRQTGQPETGAPGTGAPKTEAPEIKTPPAGTPGTEPSTPATQPQTTSPETGTSLPSETRREDKPPARTLPQPAPKTLTREAIAAQKQKALMEEYAREMERVAKDPNHPLHKALKNGQLSPEKFVEHFSKGLPRPPGFNEMLKIILPFEDDKVNEHEPNGGISKYGINSKAHPYLGVKNLSKEEIKKLTPAQIEDLTKQKIRNLSEKEAAEIIKAEYENKLKWPGGDKNLMSFAVRTIALDAAVNGGLESGNRMLRQSYEKAHGDVTKMPEIMIHMRREHYARLIKDEPKKYADYKDGWERRVQTLESLTKRHDMMVPTVSLTANLPFDPKAISDTYHMRHNHPTHGGPSLHRGTDYAMKENTLLPATSAGQVVSAREHTGYGQTLIISHGNGIFEMYAHLNHVLVKEGDLVKKGQGIARSGSTGEGTGAHLHHELWLKKGNDYYAIDERDAVNRNLLDPNVREMLIKKAEKVSDIYSIKPTIMGDIPAEFRDNAELTRRIPAEDEPLVASSAGTKPTDLTIR